MENQIRKLTKDEIKLIEKSIGYSFKSKGLLNQAFIRKTYCEEHKEEYSNELLEFIGDRTLDLVVTKALSDKYSYQTKKGNWKLPSEDNRYVSTVYNNKQILRKYKSAEGFFTMIKQDLVKCQNLSRCMGSLDLYKFIIKGSNENKTINRKSKKEDLFEAIIGAMTIDSDFNFNKLYNPVLKMLDFENSLQEILNEDINEDVLRVEKWHKENFKTSIIYDYFDENDHNTVINDDVPCLCIAHIGDRSNNKTFLAHGDSKREARIEACKKIAKFLFDDHNYKSFAKTLKKKQALPPKKEIKKKEKRAKKVEKKNEPEKKVLQNKVNIPERWTKPNHTNVSSILNEMKQVKIIDKLRQNPRKNNENKWACSISCEVYGKKIKSSPKDTWFATKEEAKRNCSIGLVNAILSEVKK